MPRYHFNIRDGQHEADSDGTELEDIRAARIEAVWLMGSLMRDYPDRFICENSFHVEVTDAGGSALFNVNVAVMDPLASRGASAS